MYSIELDILQCTYMHMYIQYANYYTALILRGNAIYIPLLYVVKYGDSFLYVLRASDVGRHSFLMM